MLIPDFKGVAAALRTVLKARPQVLNHNIETVPRLYTTVRPGAVYARSLELLGRVKTIDASVPTNSGLMLGLGETTAEIRQTLQDLLDVGCRHADHRPVSSTVERPSAGGPISRRNSTSGSKPPFRWVSARSPADPLSVLPITPKSFSTHRILDPLNPSWDLCLIFKTKDGCRLFFETFGVETQKTAVVFLNGTIQTTINWRPQALCLKKSTAFSSTTPGPGQKRSRSIAVDPGYPRR